MIFHNPIYPITDCALSGKSHADQVRQLIDSGVSIIQLREKHRNSDEFYADAKEALRIGREAGIKIVINDRVDIALALDADGVHLGQEDLPPDEARKLLGNKAIIGFSTHDIDQVKEAVGLNIDYLAFGPVFSTATKENPEPVTGIEELKKIVMFCDKIPVVAIGGITSENISVIGQTGADACAVISAVFSIDKDASSSVAALTRISHGWRNRRL